MSKKSIASKIIISLLVGVCATLFFAQYDPWVQEQCVTYIQKKIEQDTHCKLSYAKKKIRFFLPELTLYDVNARACDARDNTGDASDNNGKGDNSVLGDVAWQWHAKQLTVSFSWWHIFKYGSLDFHVSLENCEIESQLAGDTLAIMPHVYSFFATSSGLPVASFVKEVELLDSFLRVTDTQRGVISSCHFKSNSKELFGTFKTMVHIRDADIKVHENTLVSHVDGMVHMVMPGFLAYKQPGPKLHIGVDFSVDVPHLDKPTCFVSGTWEDGVGSCTVRHVEQQVTIDPLTITRDEQGVHVDGKAQLPLSYVWRLFKDSKSKSAPAIEGDVFARVQGCITGSQELKVSCDIKNIQSDQQPICSVLTIDAHHTDQLIHADFKANVHDVEIGGSGQLQYATGQAKITLNNINRVVVPGLRYWYCDPQDISCTLERDSRGALSGSYQCRVHDSVHQIPYQISGEFKQQDDACTVQGAVNNGTYTAQLSLAPLALQKFEYQDSTNTSLVLLTASDSRVGAYSAEHQNNAQKKITGSVSYALARSLLNGIAGIDVQGQGIMAVDASYDDQRAQIHLALQDGIIRLPHTYNFIDRFGVSFDVDYAARTIVMRNLACGLQTGSLRCERATLQFDDARNVSFVHVPLVFDRCLFNMQKNLFAMVSGSFLFEKRAQETPSVKGRLIIDRAHAKDAAFLSDIYKACTQSALFMGIASGAGSSSLCASNTFSKPDIGLDIGIETKEPIHLDTPLLKADVRASLEISGSVGNPRVEGDLVFDSGSLMFPYKPLQIIKGSVHFDPDTITNPAIELKAKNAIKKHEVTLYVQGTLQDHHVLLDASPALTEEQVIALLFVGSPEESLSAMVPALIMQNLKMALLGSSSGSFLDKYFNKSRMPFSVNLVPSFTDQTGRGGLRGGLEFLVNDRWRALIQKNFSLSEDTRFELEYAFSDDVGFRLTRDERRDIGGEVEMRWKF